METQSIISLEKHVALDENTEEQYKNSQNLTYVMRRTMRRIMLEDDDLWMYTIRSR